jgi:hypothetical protein
MKRSAKIMSFAMALSVTTAMVPLASAQTQLSNPGAPPTPTQVHQQQSASNQKQQAPTIEPRVRPPAPQLELLVGMLLRAQSSELGIPVVSKGGPTGRTRREPCDASAYAVLGPDSFEKPQRMRCVAAGSVPAKRV